MKIVDTIYLWAEVLPHRAAIIQTEMVTTFQGLADAIESIGERIDHLNLSKQEPVAVCLANPTFAVATIFALLRRGYTAAPVNARLYPNLAGGGMRTMIYDTGDELPAGVRNIRFDPSWLPGPQQAGTPRAYRKRTSENPNIIFFTSGTTGTPKKVVQPAATLDHILSNPVTRAAAAHQKVLVMGGLSSGFGLNRVCEVLYLARTVCFAADGISALSLINLFGIEVALVSATQALGLVETKRANPGLRTDSLRTIFIAGAKVQPEGIARIQSVLCRNVVDFYSSLETSIVAIASTDAPGGLSGATTVPGVEIEMVDEAGREVPRNVESFIRVRSPHLMENIKAASPNTITGVRDEWFYPGDVGSIDDNNVLHLVGRGSDVINRGGIKISGNRIEEILNAMPEIKEAAACGVFGSSGIEELWIGVVATGPIDIERIKNCLREHKEIQMEPDEVIFLDQLPRGDLGKVQKSRLKERLIELRRGS